jgi:hypothetical protein
MDEGWATAIEYILNTEHMGRARADAFFKQFRVADWVADPSPLQDLPIITENTTGNNSYGRAALGYLALKEMFGDALGRGRAVVAMERAPQPSLLELGQPALIVQRAQPELGVDRVDGVDAGQQRRPAERARGAQPLEAVDDLEPIALDEHRQCGELAVRGDRDCVWAQYTVFVENREAVQKALQEQGIPTAVHYPLSLNRQPAYRDDASAAETVNSHWAAERVMSLPMSADLTHAQQDRVVAALRAAVS